MSRPSIDNILTRRPLIVAFIFITLCLLPVMVMRDFTPDNELRYLQIADEAIQEGHMFTFTLDGEAYADKPPLYLWIVMLCKILLGKHSMLLLSLFSLVPAFVTISVMDRWSALEKVPDRLAVAFMMMTCALFLGASILLRMDMLMTMFIVLALRSFWLMYTGADDPRKQSVLMPVWIFLAIFTKGPVGLLMPVVAIVCFLLVKRQGKDIWKYLGWKTCGILALLCALWFAGVYIEGGKSYLQNLLVHQTFGRAFNSFHHKAPFWRYLVAIWYIFAPYMFLLIGSLVVSFRQPGEKERFFSVTIVSTFVTLSLLSSKMAIYLVPLMPFMVLLFVEVLRRKGWEKWMTWTLAVPVGFAAVLALGILLALFFGNRIPRLSGILDEYPFLGSWTLKLAAILLFSGMALAINSLVKGKPSIALMFIGASMLLTMYSASSVMPKANDWIGYRNLCATIPSDAEVASTQIRRPLQMKVYLGRDVSDYKNDFQAFKAAEIDGRTASDGPVALVTRTAKLAGDEGLASFVESNNHWIVGPYCAVLYNVEESETKESNNL